MYALYLVVVVGFSLAVARSVGRSVMAMSPARPKVVEKILSFRECREEMQSLWRELDTQRQGLSQWSTRASRVDERWAEFRVGWLQRHRQLEASCAVESRERQPLRLVFRQLEKTMDLYTTHAVQFAGEMGPTIDRLNTLFSELREAPLP
jgi:hypothetical protein